MAKNRFPPFICALLIIACQRCIAADPNEQAQALYATASQLEEAKKYEDAKIIYQQIVQQYPDSPIIGDASIHLSRFNTQAMIIAGNQAGADAEVNSVTIRWANHHDLPWYLYVIAKQYEKLNRNDEAKSRYQKVIAQFPDTQAGKDARLHFSRFEVLSMITSGNQVGADAEISKITADYQNHQDLAWYLYGVGNQYEKLDQNDKAKAIYQRILQQYPNSPVAPGARLHFSRYNVASLIASGNMAAAQAEIDSMKVAFPNHPDLAWYLNAVANQYEQSEKYQEAKGIYQQTTTQLPDTAVVPGTQVGFADYAKLQAVKVDIFNLIDSDNLDAADAAIAKLKTDFATHPMLSEAMFQIAEKCYKKGLSVLHQEADPNNRFFKKSVAILENDIVNIRKNLVYYLLGLNCWRLGDYDKAIQVYTDFYLYDPDQLDMCLFAIALCHEKKADGEAVEAYKTVIENCPDSPFAFQAKVKLSERGVK